MPDWKLTLTPFLHIKEDVAGKVFLVLIVLPDDAFQLGVLHGCERRIVGDISIQAIASLLASKVLLGEVGVARVVGRSADVSNLKDKSFCETCF